MAKMPAIDAAVRILEKEGVTFAFAFAVPARQECCAGRERRDALAVDA